MTNYHKRFNEVLKYIEANLDAELSVDELSPLANLSKYHFHRQISAFFGVSVISLARFLRLKRAAFRLAYRADDCIIDIALTNGYESQESFSRAFKKHFNASPLAFRKMPDWAFWQHRYEPIITLRKTTMIGKSERDVEVKDFPATLIAAMEHRGSPHQLGNTIRQFITWRKANQLPPSKSQTFNLIYDDPAITAPENFRFDIACSIEHPVTSNDFNVVNKEIPTGKCAVVRHIGSDDTIGLVVDFLYSTWLPNSAYQLRDFPIFLERVSFFPEVPECEMITDVFLPIQ